MKSQKIPTAPELEEPLLPRAPPNQEQGEPYVETSTVAAPVAQQVIRVRVQEAEVLVEPSVVADVVTVPLAASNNGGAGDGASALQGQGRWKDSLCNCCGHGCCHPSLLCATFCPLIAVAQVMRRLNLLMTGKQGSNFQSKITFFIIFAFSITIHYLFRYVLFPPPRSASEMDENGNLPRILENYPWIYKSVIPFSSSFFLFYLIVITRSYIRRKYRIPERHCVGCEDCCVAALFPCCAISQMARHTTDYDLYRAQWCSDTGLPGSVPSIV